MPLLTKIFGDPNEKYIGALQPIIDRINELEDSFKGLSDEELRGKTDEFRGRLHDDETLDDILSEGFAAVQRLRDVRLVSVILMFS